MQVLENDSAGEAETRVTQNAEYIVFRNRAVVAFYTNDLHDTPLLSIHTADEHEIKCVHGLEPLHRWIDKKSMLWKTFQVPSIIVENNSFMDGVGRFDQIRSTWATIRKEKRVTMSMISFVMETSVLIAHALLRLLSKLWDRITDAATVKHRLLTQLVSEYAEYKPQSMTLKIPWRGCFIQQPNADIKNAIPEPHMLLETEGKKACIASSVSFLCKINSGSWALVPFPIIL